ncbi:MAG: hypothetical protein WCL13_01325 [bacterium]
MLEYLQKFNNLPADLKQKVSGAEAIKKIEALERKYSVALAALIMKVMVREITLNDLASYLIKENILKERAEELALELKEKIFSSLGNYFLAEKVKPIMPIAPVKDAPPTSEPKVENASFFFSPDDEEEIRGLIKKIVIVEDSNLASGTIDDKLKEIISRAKINFGSADLVDRFSQILRTYLRGIRNKLETKTTLIKPFLNGGLSFDEDSAEKVMSLADKVLNPVKSSPIDAAGFNEASSATDQPIKPAPKSSLPELKKSDFFPKREISRDAAYDFSKLAGKDKNSAQGGSALSGDLKKLDTKHELAPLTPAIRPTAVTQKNELKVKEKNLTLPKNIQTEAAPIKPAVNSDLGTMPLIKRRFEAENLNQSQKIKVEDVKYVPRVMGPLDEIKYMDLINFRRLDGDPLKSADKIKSKIDLLEEENYGKKLEGIKFWRLSPISKLYLEVGRLSISEKKPIDVIIEERKVANSDYLTADEFKAIMDLNKSLRF